MKFPLSPIVIVSLLVFLLTPYVPNVFIKTTVGNPVGVFVLLAATLYFLRYSVVDGLAVFLACGALFLQNRKRILIQVERIANASGDDSSGKRVSTPSSVANASTPAEDLVEGEVHPDHDTPSGEETTFQPKAESETNDFKAVDQTINEKVPLETANGSANDMASRFVKNGFTN